MSFSCNVCGIVDHGNLIVTRRFIVDNRFKRFSSMDNCICGGDVLADHTNEGEDEDEEDGDEDDNGDD